MTALPRRRLLALGLSTALLAACATPPAPPSKPQLLVLLVVDGLPMRQLIQVREQLAPDGFARFLTKGRWYSDANYGHAHTVTAAGHSVMLTGAHPERTGIISNEWRDPQSGEPVYCTQDSEHRYLDNPTAPLSGTSPRLLKAETLGDVLRRLDPQAKVIGISGKDRGAILPAGHAGTAYMYMGETGRFASSTYYMSAHPAWVNAFNAAKPADAFFKRSWVPLLPEAAYAGSAPDGQPWQVASGNGNRLPAVIGDRMDAPGPRFYTNLLASPFGDELTLAFARAAIAGEQLGQRGRTDILTVSLSSHDYVNHAMGPESRLSHDHLLHLDRHLQAFFAHLDTTLGAGNYLAALTADHGFAETPEWATSQGRSAGRLTASQVVATLNQALATRFGAEGLVRDVSAGGLLLNDARIAERRLDPAAVQAATRDEALKLPGVAAAFTLAELQSTDAATPYLAAVRRSWHAGRSASVQLVTQPGWIWSFRMGGSTHGSPHRYDTHVPLMVWGPAWVQPGEVREPVGIVDLAPSLARVLGLDAPAHAQGRDLGLHGGRARATAP